MDRFFYFIVRQDIRVCVIIIDACVITARPVRPRLAYIRATCNTYFLATWYYYFHLFSNPLDFSCKSVRIVVGISRYVARFIIGSQAPQYSPRNYLVMIPTPSLNIRSPIRKLIGSLIIQLECFALSNSIFTHQFAGSLVRSILNCPFTVIHRSILDENRSSLFICSVGRSSLLHKYGYFYFHLAISALLPPFFPSFSLGFFHSIPGGCNCCL